MNLSEKYAFCTIVVVANRKLQIHKDKDMVLINIIYWHKRKDTQPELVAATLLADPAADGPAPVCDTIESI